MLFYLDEQDKTALYDVKPCTLQDLNWVEKDLENLVANHIDRIILEDQLLVIHQERQYQEEPDLMALDKKGALHIFELKRWQSSPENLLQVLRYGQRFGQYDFSSLNHLFQSYVLKMHESAQRGLDDVHQEHFELPEKLAKASFNNQQRFIVMTNGLDQRTIDAIEYWKKHNLPVSGLVYQAYKTNSGDALFEIRPYGPEGDTFTQLNEGLRVVNTNVTYMQKAWRDMLEREKASAYYERKTAVRGIPKGSPIALYHTGVGIIALGRTTDTFRRAPCGEDPDEEYFVPCKFDFKVDPIREKHRAVTAREINDYLHASHRFRLTVYTLPGEAEKFIADQLRQKMTKA